MKWIIILLGVFAFISLFLGNDDSQPAPVAKEVAHDPHTLAVWACREAVRRQLKDRDSGKFELPEQSFAELKGDTWQVQIDGKAKNSFGAVLDHTWNCTLKVIGKDFLPVAVKEIR